MAIKRASHVVYDTRYYIVWARHYHKCIGTADLKDLVEQCFKEAAIHNNFEMEAVEVAEDDVNIFSGFPPKYWISHMVKRLKGASARAIFERYPEVKRELWGGKFWEDGYFACTVGDKVTKDSIKKYITKHKNHERTSEQLELH